MAKVMLVEDDNNLREIYAARLQAEGYTVVSAKDGEEALVIAKSEKPDLIISDVMMPKISGFEMLDILRNTDGLRDVKIIMLTALGQSDDELRANRLGADRYLVKSQVTLEDIVKVSRDLLAGDAVAVPPATPAPTAAPIAVTKPPADPAASATVAAPAISAPAPAPAAPAQSTTTINDARAGTKDAATTAQELAAVDAEVESFVAGATTKAPAPAAATATPSTASAATPPAASTAAQTSDDKLLSDAATTMAAKTDSPTPSSDSPATSSRSDQPERKKAIITPIDSEPKKDLATLLAQEQVREAAEAAARAPSGAASTAPPIVVGGNDAPAQVVTPPAGPDPNSIAL